MDFDNIGPRIFDYDVCYIKLRGIRKRIVDFVPRPRDCKHAARIDLASEPRPCIDSIKRHILPSISDNFEPVDISLREHSILLFT
jgi:hypothetical protein